MLAVFGVLACDDDEAWDRGSSTVGAPCRASYECPSNHCCMTPHCGHGMCTFPCRTSLDCPSGTACDEHSCFWMCRSDADCAWGEHCDPKRGLCFF